jgi:probable blue pigment (indigoidine) exporter
VQDARMTGGVEVVHGAGAVRRRAEATGIGMLAFAVIVWGCVGRVIAEGSSHADPLMLTGLRAAPAALVLLIALPLLRHRLPSTRDEWIRTAISGLLMVTWFLYGLTESVAKAGPGTAIVLLSTSPFFIILAERYVYGKRVTRAMLLGMVIGFGGIVLIVSGQLGSSGDTGDKLVGMALAISAAIAWSIGTLIVADQITRDPETDLVGLTTGQYIIGGSVLLVLAFAIEGPGAADWDSTTLWLVVAFISIVASALATVAYFSSLRWLDPAAVTTWMFLSPVVAVLLEVVLGNVPTVLVLLGMAITIAGVAVVSAAPRPAEPAG